MAKYFRSTLMAFLMGLATFTFMRGGWWIWAAFVGTMVVFAILDAVLPDDLSEPSYGMTGVLDFALYMVLPLLFVMDGTFIWLAAPSGDPLGIAALVQRHLGFDLFAARAATNHWAIWLGGILSAGLMTATAGTVVGHELTHRLKKPLDLFLGRWMLAFTCDVAFATEHVFGHHVTVGTPEDPVTARRGQTIYSFVPRAIVGAYAHAWKLERDRLKKRGHSVWNPLYSPVMRGNFMSLALFAGAYALGGWFGLALFAAVALWGKILLEITNYFEHYGLVRDPSVKTEFRHSWNSNKMLSSAVLFSLTRHSHHHADPEAEFWKLKAYPDAPTLPYGYLTTIVIAFVPPLFERMMVPLLEDWDRRFATPVERRLAAEQNRRSGIRALMATAN